MATLGAKKMRLLAVLLFGAIAGTACAPTPATPPEPTAAPGVVTIMGPARASAAQLAAWFRGRTPHPSGTYNASVPLDTLVQIYIQEGAAEGVRGDVAFIQSIIETGWFRMGGSVPSSYNNFAGLGATDSGGAPARFPDARTGVRAQIQHLRAYADSTATKCAVPPLHYPCVDPRFNLVSPKGKATTWNKMGNGNWATDPNYASKILTLYAEMLRYNGLPTF
jgi:mannosyl-glycoprotein endo-beta-N-acetylglucosaminidase